MLRLSFGAMVADYKALDPNGGGPPVDLAELYESTAELEKSRDLAEGVRSRLEEALRDIASRASGYACPAAEESCLCLPAYRRHPATGTPPALRQAGQHALCVLLRAHSSRLRDRDEAKRLVDRVISLVCYQSSLGAPALLAAPGPRGGDPVLLKAALFLIKGVLERGAGETIRTARAEVEQHAPWRYVQATTLRMGAPLRLLTACLRASVTGSRP